MSETEKSFIEKSVFNNISLSIILSLMGGLAYTLFYVNTRLYFWQMPTRRQLLYACPIFFFFSLLVFFLLFRLSLPKLNEFPRRIRALWISVISIVGILLASYFSISYHNVVTWHRLEFVPLNQTGQENIQLLEIKINNEKIVTLDEFPHVVHYKGLYNHRIYNNSDGAVLAFDFWGKFKDELLITFSGQTKKTPLEIILDSKTTEFDLYDADGGNKAIGLVIDNQNLSQPYKIILFTADSIVFIYSMLFISIWLWFI